MKNDFCVRLHVWIDFISSTCESLNVDTWNVKKILQQPVHLFVIFQCKGAYKRFVFLIPCCDCWL